MAKQPWDTNDKNEGLAGFVLFFALIIGLIISLYSCDFEPPKISEIAKKKPVTETQVSKGYEYKTPRRFSNRRFRGKNWGNDPTWRSLDQYQMVAAMAILETRKRKDGSFCFKCSENIVHTIINRASLDGDKLPAHVSKPIYQPVIEPYQYKMLARYVGTPAHKRLSVIAYKRHTGQIKDKINGATHYLVHSRVMVALQRKKPCKYWNWGPFKCKGRAGDNWTGYNPATKRYKNQVYIDSDHAFLAPAGKHSAKTLLPDG